MRNPVNVGDPINGTFSEIWDTVLYYLLAKETYYRFKTLVWRKNESNPFKTEFMIAW